MKVTDDMNLLSNWDFERNELLGFDPSSMSRSAHTNVCWKCRKGHHLILAPHNKKPDSCAYCYNHKLLPGSNDLKTLRPDIAEEWAYEENYPFTPDMFYPSEATVVWWKCSKCGIIWDDSINHRTSTNRGCPYCDNDRVGETRVLKGINDLASTDPDVSAEWDTDRNLLFPFQVSAGSNKYAWWKCKEGHRWRAQISSRTGKNGRGCPYCAGQAVFPGFNDLATKNPDLADEWNYEKNDTLTPKMFTSNSTEVVWWRCRFCNHEWISSIDNRMRDRGCPNCKKRSRTSFPEQAIVFYLQPHFPDVVNAYRGSFNNSTSELDVYIPSIKVGIEYDGPEHKKVEAYQRDLEKYIKCTSQGITLYRVRQSPGTNDSSLCDVLITSNYDTNRFWAVDEFMHKLFRELGLQESPGEIKCSRDRNAIRSLYYDRLKENSLEEKYPEVAKEWHPTKNAPITPAMVSFGSGDKFWWKCSKCDNEWEAVVSSRTSSRHGCKKCADIRSGKAKSRAVEDVDSGEVFESIKDAAVKCRMCEESIRKVCQGKKDMVKGRRFRYRDES